MIAVVTGGSDGIGFSVCQRLSESGHTVYSISKSEANTQFAMTQIKADVSDYDALMEAMNTVISNEGRIDWLILCAGVSMAAPCFDADLHDARAIFDTNYWGCVHALHAAVPAMLTQGKGRIVLVSSVTGILPVPYFSFYGGSKSAVISLAASAYEELGPSGIDVIGVLPGSTRTDFTDKRKKAIEPEIPGLHHAIQQVGTQEQNGLYPDEVAKTIERMLNKKRPPAFKIIGMKYKCYACLERMLPSKWMLRMLRKRYTKE